MAQKITTLFLDEDLWREFKATATYHGFTLKGAVAHAIRQWIERNAIPSTRQPR